MFNPLGTDKSTETELRTQSTPVVRIDKDADYLFRFVKLVAGLDLVFLPCLTKDGMVITRALRLAKKDWTLIHEMGKIDRKLLKENFPDKETRPGSTLSLKSRFYYLVFDRLDNNNLKILELNYTIDNNLQEFEHSTSQKTPGMLKYGPLYMYDLTIKRSTKKSSKRFDVNYTLLPEANEFMDKIPVESLSEKYPTFKMITHYLVANLGEGENQISATGDQVKAFMQKYRAYILEGKEDSFDGDDEYLGGIVTNYIQSEINFFTEEEIDQVDKFKIDSVPTLKPHNNKDIINLLQETPMCLIGTDKFNNPYFRYPHELMEDLSSEFSHLLTTEAGKNLALPEGKSGYHLDEPPPETMEVPQTKVEAPITAKTKAKTEVKAEVKSAPAPIATATRAGWMKTVQKAVPKDPPKEENTDDLPF